MNKIPKKPRNKKMYEAILSLKDIDECMKFFDDLCTVTELLAIEQRFQVASCLDDGMIYNDILAETGASSATISRVNRSLQYGAGGYAIVFDRIKGDHESAVAADIPVADEGYDVTINNDGSKENI